MWASESLCLYKYTLGSHSEAEMRLFVCLRLHDATAARRARGYYWPAGLLWRPLVSERSNICGVFVCQDRFSSFCLLSFSFSLSLTVTARERLMLTEVIKPPVACHDCLQTLVNMALEYRTVFFFSNNSAAYVQSGSQ